MEFCWATVLLAVLAGEGDRAGPPEPAPPCPSATDPLPVGELPPPQCREEADRETLSPAMRVMIDRAIERWLSESWRPPHRERKRARLRLPGFSIGGYQPPGGAARLPGKPVRLFVTPGLGNSINTDPFTGKLR